MFSKKSIISVGMCLLLLGGMAVQTSLYPSGEKAATYHHAVKRAAAKMPADIGPWKATREPIPPAATELLRPNLTISRGYTNAKTGQSVKFMLVQVMDARDMEGHFPANCYPSFGWTAGPSHPFALDVEGMNVTGTTYEFKRDLGMRSSGITIMNIILLPQGKFGQGMKQIQQLAASYNERFYGAGQIQLIFEAGWSKKERDQVAKRLLGQMKGLMQTMLGRGLPEKQSTGPKQS